MRAAVIRVAQRLSYYPTRDASAALGLTVYDLTFSSFLIRAFLRLLLFDFHAFPEGYPALDLLGGLFGVGVVPSGVFVLLPVHAERIVAGLAFPGAGSVGNAVFKKLLFDGVGGEIVIVFNHDGVVAFGYDGVVPDSFHRGRAAWAAGIVEWCKLQRKVKPGGALGPAGRRRKGCVLLRIEHCQRGRCFPGLS